MTSRIYFLYCVFLCQLVIILPVCAQNQSKTTFSSNDFAKGWLEAWNSHNVDRILTYYTDDAYFEDVPSVSNGWDVPMNGHQMIRESLTEMFEEMSDIHFANVSTSSAGDRMVAEWIMTGTHWQEFTGKFSIPAVSIIKLKGNKIFWERDYYDTYLLMSQLGMIPAVNEE